MSWFSNKNSASPISAKATDQPKETDVEAVRPAIQTPSGGNADAYQVIVGPHVTEKATMGTAKGKYVFRVRDGAGKTSIKLAIQSLYNVTVIGVQTVRLPSKKRKIGRFEGEKSGFKKAIITLKAGDVIAIQ